MDFSATTRATVDKPAPDARLVFFTGRVEALGASSLAVIPAGATVTTSASAVALSALGRDLTMIEISVVGRKVPYFGDRVV
ncbi:MAG: hypothetical protein ACHQZS_09790 [Candidatus Binatales bacterium]